MLFDQLAQQLANRLSLLRPSKNTALKESQQEIHQAIKGWISELTDRLDLVTRDAFDTQTTLLRKTQERAQTLEEQVKILELKLTEVIGNLDSHLDVQSQPNANNDQSDQLNHQKD